MSNGKVFLHSLKLEISLGDPKPHDDVRRQQNANINFVQVAELTEFVLFQSLFWFRRSSIKAAENYF